MKEAKAILKYKKIQREGHVYYNFSFDLSSFLLIHSGASTVGFMPQKETIFVKIAKQIYIPPLSNLSTRTQTVSPNFSINSIHKKRLAA